MKGYRTLIVNVIALIATVLGMYGLDVSQETQAEIATGALAFMSVVNMALRLITTTPIGKKE